MHEKLNTSATEEVGRSFRNIYLCDGLECAIFFLRTVLAEKMSISHINVISITSDRRILVPICSTKTGCHPHREITPHGSRVCDISPDTALDSILVLNDISENIRAYTRYFSEKGTTFSGHLALLRMPFYKKDDVVYLMQFWSQTAHIFTPRRVRTIRQLLAPFVERVKKAGFPLHEKYMAEENRSPLTPNYDLLCQCRGMVEVQKKIAHVAPTDAPVLIEGETGVGKECVADALHELSARARGPLVKVNCGAISESLLDSALFGHERGSFTGAIHAHEGFFEQADRGTLFLDEIGELSQGAQVKLLRVLNDHTIQKVGSSRAQRVDVRLIAATNRDLQAMVRAGTFRKDLYYRIAVYPISVLPLRHRHEDIFVLTEHFMREAAKTMGKNVPPDISRSDIAPFYAHDWPGNLRELKNTVERLMIDDDTGQNLKEAFQSVALVEEPAGVADGFRPPAGWPTLEELKKSYIAAVLQYTRGKMTGPGSASGILGIHYTTLRAHVRKLGLSMKHPHEA